MSGVLLDTRPGQDDSPGQVARDLVARRPDVPVSWADRRGPRRMAQLARADVLLSSDLSAGRGLPRPRTTYVQTWHGTPVKLLGFDERTRSYDVAGAWLAALRRDVRRWDLLVSPGPAATEVFRSAFRYDGPVLEVGTPRNDALLAADAGVVRDRVRRELGVGDRRLVLHAPTWRDDGRPVWSHPEFVALLDALPDEVLLCARAHPCDAAPPRHPRLVDVGGRSLPGLLLAADVLVSDYSAVVADFAVTRKPIVLFAPDLAEYAALRGLYQDYGSWAPGRVARTAYEVVEAVKEPEVDHAVRQRFLDTWCPNEDGHAGERVVDALVALL